MLTDSHCHLASSKFPREEITALIARAHEAGVDRLITLATCLDDLQPNLDLAATHAGVHACLGIHPTDVPAAPDDAVAQIRPLLTRPEVAAVGETGLDYFHPAPEGMDETTHHQRQAEFLEQHFQAAREERLNVVIHTRDRQGNASFRDALEIYRRHAGHVRAVFHCYVGTLDDALSVLELGGLVSFGGVATFNNATAVLEVASSLPLGQFMLETDAPYLAPHPHRGQRNEPARVRLVAEKIAAARGLSPDELARSTSETARNFFRIAE